MFTRLRRLERSENTGKGRCPSVPLRQPECLTSEPSRSTRGWETPSPPHHLLTAAPQPWRWRETPSLGYRGPERFPGCKEIWDDLGTLPGTECPNQRHRRVGPSETLSGSTTGSLPPHHPSPEASSTLNQSTDLGEGFLLNIRQLLFWL